MTETFAAAVIAWQRTHGRHDLPWQSTRDPYRIWLAEVMLQQTQVATVVPYYLRFIERFPDVAALARAALAEVMAAWSGLGYYSRARHLHRCAMQVVEHHRGRFPSTARELMQLPGIGRSTAAAIAAFAFGERAAILDGNVKRVLARAFEVEGLPQQAAVEARLWAIADAQLPRTEIEPYTQGLMDLGATVCTRSRPRCAQCPLALKCGALRQGRVDELPMKKPRRARRQACRALLIVRNRDGAVLLEQRPAAGIWGGLQSLPEFDGDADDGRLQGDTAARYGLNVTIEQRLPDVTHEFTHYTLTIRPALAVLASPAALSDCSAQFVPAEALHAAPLPAPVRRLLATLA